MKTLRPKITVLKKPISKKIGGWVEMKFDAKTECYGMTWLRVQNGFNERGDREDWVADIPSGSLAVHDYNFIPKKYWGPHNYKSFEEACFELAKEALRHRRHEREKILAQLAQCHATIAILEKAVED